MRDETGFTLVECLVALLIMALAMTAALSAFSTGARHALHAGRHAATVATAHALLEGMGIDRPLEPGSTEGRSGDGFAWRIDVVRRDVAQVLKAMPMVSAYWVSVTVASGEARPGAPGAVTLSTLRLQPP